MKVTISTGQGRLHLIESAKSLLNIGIDASVITGWIPGDNVPAIFISILSKITRNPNLKSGFQKRKISTLSSSKIHTCSLAEFFLNFLFICSRYKLFNRSKAAVVGWHFFGYQSRSFIKKIDVFHVRSGAGQGGAIEKARRNGAKIVVDHSIAHPQEVYNQLLKANDGVDDGIEISPNNRFWKLVLKDCDDADILLVNSEYIKESFIKNGYPDYKIEVAELGMRDDFISLKKDWKIENEIKLLFTGGFGRRKGGNIIIETTKLLEDRGIPYQLNILGSILNDIAIPDWFKNSSRVHLRGPIPQDDLKDYFISSDIYIFPSYCEGAAQSLKEAMAAGLPVIATKQSGVSIENKKTGILIEDHSAAELMDAILSLSQDIELRSFVASNAIEEIKNNHKWVDYANKLEKLYARLQKSEVAN